jgi:hypothetical protein
LEVPMDSNQFVSYRTVTAKTKIVPQSKKPPQIKVKISVNGSLTEYTGKRMISDPRYRQIKETTRLYIKNKCRETIALIQSWEADILDFGLEYRYRYPEEFDPKTWRRRFKEAKVDVEVDFRVVRSGLYH